MEQGKTSQTFTFIDGINTVMGDRYLSPNNARSIVNCRLLSSAKGNLGLTTNIKGNVIIPYTLPAGNNICIGSFPHQEYNKVYLYVYNDGGKHSILEYDDLTNTIVKIIESRTDTNNIDILNFQRQWLILHIDIFDNNKMYWVDGYNDARKINIDKAKDKTYTGYGPTITLNNIQANKKAPFMPAVLEYISDNTKNVNYMYGNQWKVTYYYIYDDGEFSTCADFSKVPMPLDENFKGEGDISNKNNGIKIKLFTGDESVQKIGVGVAKNDNKGFKLIAVLDKEFLNIPNYATYELNFFNDEGYTPISDKDTLRPFSIFPKKPRCQALVENAITYAYFKEGFDEVVVDATVATEYVQEDFSTSLIPTPNAPSFGVVFIKFERDPIKGKNNDKKSIVEFTIGPQVARGNQFILTATFSDKQHLYWNDKYVAKQFDTPYTVANYFQRAFVAAGQKSTDVSLDGDGTARFRLEFRAKEFVTFFPSVQPVSLDSIGGTNKTIKVNKSGTTLRYAIEYEDSFGQKTLAFTSDTLLANSRFISQSPAGTVTVPVHVITINHRPPSYAVRFQLLRTFALNYDKYVQFMTVNITPFTAENGNEFLDLNVTGLDGYKKLNPNNVINYQWEKGDRVRFIKNKTAEVNTYYDFLETEALSFNNFDPITISEKVQYDGDPTPSSTLTVEIARESYVGAKIIVNGVERLIVSRVNNTTYAVDKTLVGDFSGNSYQIVLGAVIRIRKPTTITPGALSLIEVFTPAKVTDAEEGTFRAFGEKYDVINPGTTTAYHSANFQNQSATVPAIFKIKEGSSYMRLRELPTTYNTESPQTTIDVAEDENYSDFYASSLDDDGRLNIKFDGQGEKEYTDTIVHSNNAIEGTKIIGLNIFDNSARRPYADKNGKIMKLFFDRGQLLILKELRSCWIYINKTIVDTGQSQSVLATSTKLLGDINYYNARGGIGNHPESFSASGFQKFFVSTNMMAAIRLSQDGETPVSVVHGFDNEFQDIVKKAELAGAFIWTSPDPGNNSWIIAVQNVPVRLYSGGMEEGFWKILYDTVFNPATFEIVTAPTKGTVAIDAQGKAIFTSTGALGEDFFTYRAKDMSAVYLPTRKLCLNVIAADPGYAWRVKAGSACVKDDDGNNTGEYRPTTLEKYNIATSVATGEEKPNIDADPDFIPGVQNTGLCPLPSTSPTPFTFVDVTGVDINTEQISNAITIAGLGLGYSVPVTVAGGLMSKNGNPYTDLPQLGFNGDTFSVKRNSSPSYNTTVDVILTAGTVSDTYSITTQNGAPTAFAFVDVTGKEISTSYTSNTIVTAGYVGTLAISIVDGEYSINGGAFTSAPGNVAVGSNVAVRRTSSSAYNTAVSTTLTIGTLSDTYTITTRVAANVAVNYTMVFGANPTTAQWNVFSRTRAGVTSDVATISSATSGALPAGTFVEGDTITVYQGAYVAFEWAPTSKVNLKMDISGVEYYNADVTTQVSTQNTTAYVIAPGVVIIDVISTGSSTAVGYITESLHVVNSIATLGVLEIDITDNLEAGLGIVDLSPSASATTDYPFNVKGTTNTLTVVIRNTSAIDFTYTLNGEGGYTHSGTVAASSSVTWADVTKGGVEVIIPSA